MQLERFPQSGVLRSGQVVGRLTWTSPPACAEKQFTPDADVDNPSWTASPPSCHTMASRSSSP